VGVGVVVGVEVEVGVVVGVGVVTTGGVYEEPPPPPPPLILNCIDLPDGVPGILRIWLIWVLVFYFSHISRCG